MPFWLIAAMVVVSVALTLVSSFLTPKPSIEGRRPKALGDFNFPTATESRQVPFLWGTVDIKGPNVIWYGDLQTVKIKKTIKTGLFSSDKITIAIDYYVGMDLLLGYGPLDRVTRLEVSDREVTFSPVDVPAGGDAGVPLVLNEPKLLGGREKGGGIGGTYRIYGGTPNQERNVYLQNILGVDIPSYLDIAHIVAERTLVGESEQIGQYVWRVTRFPDNLGLDLTNHIVNGDITDGETNIAEAMYELLTNQTWGLSVDPANIDTNSFRVAGNTLFAEGQGWSMIQDSKIDGIELLSEMIRQIDGMLIENTDGIFTLKLIRNDYVLANQPLFDESNVISVGAFSRSSWDQTQNHITVAYTDSNKNFIETSALAQDTANFQIQDNEVRGDMEFPGVKNPALATQIAARELKTNAYPLATVTLECTREAATLSPGDVIRWSNEVLGIVEMPIRLISVAEGTVKESQVQIKGAQDIFQIPDDAERMASPQPSQWFPVDNTAKDSTFQFVAEAPQVMMRTSLEYIGTAEDTSLSRLLSGAVARDNVQLDYEQWVDQLGGAGFEGFIAETNTMTASGLLLSDYSSSTTDIDATGFTIYATQGVADGASETSLSHLKNIPDGSEILFGNNVAMIKGATQAEDEIIGWETLVDNLNGSFTLSGVHRGLMDTAAQNHAADARIFFLSDQMSTLSTETYGETQSIDIKHLPSTSQDKLELADAATLNLTFARRSIRCVHPPNFECEGTRVPIIVRQDMVAGNLDFTWEHRTPFLDDDIWDANQQSLIHGSSTPQVQDTDVEYDLRFYHAVTDVLVRTYTLNNTGTWLAQSWPDTTAQSDTGEVGDYPLRVRMRGRYKAVTANGNPANLTSEQEILADFASDIGGGTKQSIDLDGSTEYLAQTSNVALDIADTWSIGCWVRSDLDVGGTERFFLHLGQSVSDNNRIELSIDDDADGSAFRIRMYNSAGVIFKDWEFGAYTVNTWHYVSATWDGTTLRVYVDSVQDTTPIQNVDAAGTQTDTTRRVVIGVDKALTGGQWSGLIHQTLWWSERLLDGAIQTLYNAGDGSAFDVRNNTGNYQSRDALQHLWDYRKSGALTLGQDYGASANLRNITDNSANVDATDLSATVPT